MQLKLEKGLSDPGSIEKKPLCNGKIRIFYKNIIFGILASVKKSEI